MRIGIDARLYNKTGVGRYIKNIIKELSQIDKENTFIIYLSKDDINTVTINNPRWTKKILDVKWHTLSEQVIVPLILYKDKLDIAHFPYFNVPIFYSGKYLLTIHDLIVDHYDTGRASTLPAIFYKFKRAGYHLVTTLAVRKASLISTISETTKQEIIDHYHPNLNKLFVTFDALDSEFKKNSKVSPTQIYKFPYILYVGNAYPHKNLEILVAIWHEIKKEGVKLVLAGNDNYFYPRLKHTVIRQKLDNDVIFFGEANELQLKNLYSYAACLIFPSLMEGFGLPNLEALYNNCLPLVSDIPVFREIWADSLIYFNPLDADDIKKKIIMTLKYSKREYLNRIAIAKKKLNQFSWKKTAYQTLALYQEIYKLKL